MRRDGMNRLVKVIPWCLLVAFGASVVGCHTIHGAGEDVAQAGRAIERATDECG
jgi:predicted small secreted protein